MVLGIIQFNTFSCGINPTGVLLHGSHNLFIQSLFDPITADTGRTRYVVGEFGAGLASVSIAFAIYFWTRRKALEPEKVAAAAA